MQPKLTNETFVGANEKVRANESFVGEFALRFVALLEALSSPGSPLSELPGLLRASKRATERNLN